MVIPEFMRPDAMQLTGDTGAGTVPDAISGANMMATGTESPTFNTGSFGEADVGALQIAANNNTAGGVLADATTTGGGFNGGGTIDINQIVDAIKNSNMQLLEENRKMVALLTGVNRNTKSRINGGSDLMV